MSEEGETVFSVLERLYFYNWEADEIGRAVSFSPFSLPFLDGDRTRNGQQAWIPALWQCTLPAAAVRAAFSRLCTVAVEVAQGCAFLKFAHQLHSLEGTEISQTYVVGLVRDFRTGTRFFGENLLEVVARPIACLTFQGILKHKGCTFSLFHLIQLCYF